MNGADFVICAVLLVSTVVGVSRGVVREILAIVGWAVAIFLALNYSPELARVIPLESLGTAVRTACAAVIIVVLTLFLVGRNALHAVKFKGQINALLREELFYRERIAQDSALAEQLRYDDYLEEYARENYHMQRRDEHVYIVEE